MRDRPLVTQLEMAHVELLGQLDRAIDERSSGLFAVGDDSAVVEIRQADQEAAEEQAFHGSKRKNARGLVALARLQVARFVAQAVFQHHRPARMVAQRDNPPPADEGQPSLYPLRRYLLPVEFDRAGSGRRDRRHVNTSVRGAGIGFTPRRSS